MGVADFDDSLPAYVKRSLQGKRILFELPYQA